jgi:predicted aspartyl protease
VNGSGPYSFAIDTGAGAILISERTAAAARVSRANRGPATVSGLGGQGSVAYHAVVVSLALGNRDNYLPAKGELLITRGLPPDIDGVLDPTEALSPFGYVIDLPVGELIAFDASIDPVRRDRVPVEGAVVPWARDPYGRRPFVMLDNGDRALLDTGSSLGLAIRDSNVDQRESRRTVRDVSGAQISTRRVTTRSISIGSLTLERVPTDLVSGAAAEAPVLLGLAVLRPFRLRFDPLHRLIEIAPPVDDQTRR